MAFWQEDNMRLKYCKICGKCCNGDVLFVSEKELKNLPDNPKGIKVKDRLYKIKFNKKCGYLSKNGCILTEEQKPITCKIYPFRFVNNEWIVRTVCPYWNYITNEDFKMVKREFERRKNDWIDT